MSITDIRFPHLGIWLRHVGSGITVGGFEIKFYGMIIAGGFLLGLLLAMREARKTGQDPELYMDYLLVMIVPAIVGARLYYVAFSWDYYKEDLRRIFMIREGGLAIFGGVIAGTVVLFFFSKYKKQPFLRMADTLAMSLLVGQIMGRWGNFFNREAFGGYTDNLFAMQIPTDYFLQAGRYNEIAASGVLARAVEVNAGGKLVSCIQVHPTFLYESLWNLGILLILFFYRRHKSFDGELFSLYLIGYGIGRFWIEGLRTDQLTIGHTGIAVSRLVAQIIFGVALVFFLIKKKTAKKGSFMS